MIAFEKVVKVMEEVIKVNNLYKLYKVGDEIVHALDELTLLSEEESFVRL